MQIVGVVAGVLIGLGVNWWSSNQAPFILVAVVCGAIGSVVGGTVEKEDV